MSRVRIVTDSAADIAPPVAKQLGIVVVPLTIHFGDQSFREGVDLSPEEFYRMLATNPAFPRTSQPSAGLFEDAYRQARDDGVEVISIHLSQKLSGTLDTAMSAARTIGPTTIHCVDSMGASILEGSLVVAAARMAAEGVPVMEIVARVEALRPAVYALLMLDSLVHIQRGGRIGRAQALLGTLLSVKPMVEVTHGEVAPVQRVRTTGKALQELAADARTRQPLLEMAILHANAPKLAAELLSLLQPFAPQPEIPVQLLGPVVGVHVGQGAIGVMTMRKLRS